MNVLIYATEMTRNMIAQFLLIVYPQVMVTTAGCFEEAVYQSNIKSFDLMIVEAGQAGAGSAVFFDYVRRTNPQSKSEFLTISRLGDFEPGVGCASNLIEKPYMIIQLDNYMRKKLPNKKY